MADQRDEDTQWPDRPATEGVRILGAEEARAVVDPAVDRGDEADERLGEAESPFGAGPGVGAGARPAPPIPPPVRFGAGTPDPGTTDPGWLDPPRDPAPADAPVLPHWTEPPTGEVPFIAAEASGGVDVDDDSGVAGAASGEEGDDRDFEAWSGFAAGAPRYRDHASDWAEADFIPGEELMAEGDALGALGEPEEEPSLSAEVAERRGAQLLSPSPEPARGGVPGRPAQLEPDQPVRQAAARRGDGRDMPLAVVTGVVLAGVALFVFNLGRGPTAWFVAAIVTLGAGEVYGEVRKRGYQPATLLGLVGCFALTLGAYWKGETALPIVIALVVGFTPLWYLSQVVRARATVNMALTLFVFGYVGVTGSFGGLALGHPDGIGIIIGLVVCVVAHDVGALFIGSRIGTKKIAPRISPNKTVEGLAGGMAAAFLAGVLVAARIEPWDAGSGAWLGLAVALAAPLGDLCESMLKRDLGVKDIGGILPGHGGVLDRFDGILYALPVVYYLVRILEVGR